MKWMLVAAALAASPAVAAEMTESFQTGMALDAARWDDCQLTGKHDFAGAPGGARHYFVSVDENTPDQQCGGVPAVAEPPDFLPRSLIERAETLRRDSTCADQPEAAPLSLRALIEEQVNRSEMRLAKLHRHSITKGHWYSFDFRMTGEVSPCGSQRWVIGQWKSKVSGESPFVDQRYDNGIFHVTVNSGGCRCIVAKAEGDPHAGGRGALASFEALLAGTRAPRPLSESGVIGKCDWTGKEIENPHPDDPRGCLFDAKVSRVAEPALPDPHVDRNGRFVPMTYYVRAGLDGGPGGGPGGGRVEVYASGERVALVEGHVGYAGEIAEPQKMKFKIGNYRAKQPGAASIEVDNVRLSKTPPPWLVTAE